MLYPLSYEGRSDHGSKAGPSVAVRQRAVGGSKKTKRTPIVPSPDERRLELRAVRVPCPCSAAVNATASRRSSARSEKRSERGGCGIKRSLRSDATVDAHTLELLDARLDRGRFVHREGDGNCRNRSIELRVRHGVSIDTTAASLEIFLGRSLAPGPAPSPGCGLQRVLGRIGFRRLPRPATRGRPPPRGRRRKPCRPSPRSPRLPRAPPQRLRPRRREPARTTSTGCPSRSTQPGAST